MKLGTEMNATHPTSSQGQRAAHIFWRVFLGAAIGVTLLYALLLMGNAALAATAWAEAKPWLACWRLGLLLGLACGWRCWVGHYARWAQLDEAQQQALIGQRWRFAGVLLLVEAILVQRLPALLWQVVAP